MTDQKPEEPTELSEFQIKKVKDRELQLKKREEKKEIKYLGRPAVIRDIFSIVGTSNESILKSVRNRDKQVNVLFNILGLLDTLLVNKKILNKGELNKYVEDALENTKKTENES